MNIFPHDTKDTTAACAVMDLQTGVDMLIDHLETLAKSIGESDMDVDLMNDMQPVFWLVLRLQNDIEDVRKKVEALPKPARVAEAAE
jgi:hypothetical protein